MVPPALVLLVFVAALGFAGYQKTKNVVSIWTSIASTLDDSVRAVGVVSLVPAGLVAIWLVAKGVAGPAAAVVGLAAGGGVFCAALGLLRMEGVLLETESSAMARRAAEQPPPSSPGGRVAAVGSGVVLMVVAVFSVSLVR